jgi:hypothetical protein
LFTTLISRGTQQSLRIRQNGIDIGDQLIVGEYIHGVFHVVLHSGLRRKAGVEPSLTVRSF